MPCQSPVTVIPKPGPKDAESIRAVTVLGHYALRIIVRQLGLLYFIENGRQGRRQRI